MAEKKISELTAITAGELADDDNLLLVDTSAAETKKLAKGQLISSIQAEVTFSLDSIDPSGIFTSTGILDDDGNVVTTTFPDDDETIATTAALDDRYVQIGAGGDADTLDGQDGTYYLDYNNFTNTPTIPSNNNELTNGAGYITSADGGNAQTIDSLDSTQFLRSDAADTKTSGDLSFSDDVKSVFGTGGDLGIYHDGTNSYIDQTDATLFIRNTSETANPSGTAIDIRNADDTGIEIPNNSGVTIKRNGSTSVSFTAIGAYFATDIVLNGSTRELKFRDTTAGDFDLTLDAAQITNSDKTITLPNATGTVPVFTTAPTGAIADGTNGQVLTTDGAGGLSFTTASGGGGITTGKAIAMAMIFG